MLGVADGLARDLTPVLSVEQERRELRSEVAQLSRVC